MNSKDEGKAAPEAGAIPPGSAAMLAAAIAQDRVKDDPVAASRAEVFLDEQTNFIKLQREQLNEQRRLLLGSLRFRHAGELMSVTLQVMLGVLGLALVLALGAAVWSAMHDNGLVVEAFDVPPDFAARGLTGKVVASQLLDRLSTLQDQTDSARAQNTYKNNWGDDVKVEIPDTGISIGELNRYLRQWLGHETHIGGEVFRTATGISVTARTGSAPGLTLEGSESRLGALLQQAAEDIYARTQPYRYSVFLDNHAQHAKGDLVLQQVLTSGPASERKWAHVGLANSLDGEGDFAGGANEARQALADDSEFGLGYYILSVAQSARGRDEQALAALNGGVSLFARDRNRDLTQRAADMLGTTMRARLDEEAGDFSAAARDNETAGNLPDYTGHGRQAMIARVADMALVHDAAGSDAAMKNLGDPQSGDFLPMARTTLMQAAALGRWKEAAASARETLAVLGAFSNPKGANYAPQAAHFIAVFSPCALQPWAALAAAHSGAMADARAQIDATPADCYLALRVRGKIDTMKRNWAGAAYWFTVATKQAPSIPLAYADWGEMLLSRGDPRGAIAKFAQAHDKGPHFADALELWGEAMMLQNRSDIAVAKFEDANRYAPSWGRLHLKWGEALMYAGRRSDAVEQFAICSHLDLTADERSELAAHTRT